MRIRTTRLSTYNDTKQAKQPGLKWYRRETPADNGWISVCFAESLGLFCAVAFTGTGDRVMTSS